MIFRYSPILLSPWNSDRTRDDTAWNDYISFWYNDATETPYTLIGHSLDTLYKNIVNDGMVEIDRKVASIGISWKRSNTGEYTGSNLELRHVRLVYRQPLTPVYSWHHDCTNVSHFEQVSEWNPTWWPNRILTMDNISSDGEAIYTPVYSGDASDWCGPIFLCELERPVPARDIVRFNIQLEFLYAIYDEELIFDFFLFTEDLRPIVRFYYQQAGWLYLGYSFGVRIYDEDFRTAELSPGHTMSTALNDTFSLWVSNRAGFFGDIPYSHRTFVGGTEPISSGTEVFYLGIAPSSNEPVSDIPVLVHEIHLDYINESDPVLSLPSITTAMNNTGASFPLSVEQLAIWGVAIASAFVILVFSLQTVRYRQAASQES